MIVHADLDTGAVRLDEPGDFTAFHVAVAGGEVDDPRLGAVLAGHGRLDDGHAWIGVDALVALAGDAADPAWHESLAGMVAYAREKGFLNEDGTAIRAHLTPA